MTDKIGGAYIELGGKVDAWAKATKEASDHIEKLDKHVHGMGKSFAVAELGVHAFEKGLELFVEAGKKVVEVSAEMVEKGLEHGHSLEVLSSKLGISVDSLSELEHVAKISGVGLDDLSRGFGKMLKSIGGGGEELKKLGINISDIQGQSPDKVFAVVADKISEMKDPAERAASAMGIFGKGGMALMPILIKGGEAFREMSAEADALGLAMTDLDAAKLSEANIAGVKLKEVFGALGDQLAVELSPYISQAAEDILKFVEHAGGIKEAVIPAINSMIEGVENGIGNIHELEIGWHRVAAAVDATAALIPMTIEGAMKGVLGAINLGIEGFNKLTGKHISKVENPTGDFGWTKAVLDQGKEHLAQADEIAKKGDELAKKRKEWFEEAKKNSADKAAEEVAKKPKGGIQIEEDEFSKKQKSDAEALAKSVMTPMEKYQAKLKEIKDLKESGAITDETALRGSNQAYMDFVKDQESCAKQLQDFWGQNTDSVNEFAAAMTNLGKGQEMDFGSIAAGTSISAPGGPSDFPAGMAANNMSAADLAMMQAQGAMDLSGMQAQGAMDLSDYQANSASGLKEMQLGDPQTIGVLQQILATLRGGINTSMDEGAVVEGGYV